MSKPTIIEQNRPAPWLTDAALRLAFFRNALRRRIARGRRLTLKVPRLEGLRERHPDKPFHSLPELFFQEKGRARFTFPRASFWLEEGEMAIVPRGVPHGEKWEGEGFANAIVLFRPHGLFWTRGYLAGGQRIVTPDFFPSCARPEEYCDEIATALHEGAPEGGALVRGLTLALLARLLDVLERPQPTPEPHPHPLLRQCYSLIEAHFTRAELSVQWIARQLGCSADHLSRTFRRRTGRRLVDVIHQRRITHARQLLGDASYHIAEVAWACGFATPSYFNRVFRSLCGMTPRAYRERQAAANEGLHPGDNLATFFGDAHHLSGQ